MRNPVYGLEKRKKTTNTEVKTSRALSPQTWLLVFQAVTQLSHLT